MDIEKKIYGSLKFNIFQARSDMGQYVSNQVVATVKELLAKQDKVRMIFACAPSQKDFLTAFVKSDLDWSRIESFHMDEYVDLKDKSKGFAQFIKDKLNKVVPIKKAHFINADSLEERQAYVAALTAEPIDIVCMGVGENGHIAFNDPGYADFNDPEVLKEVELDDVCRMQQVHDGCFPTFDDVPKAAVTLTIPTLIAPKYIFCTAPGATKKAILEKMIASPVTDQIPCTILKTQENCWIYTDQQIVVRDEDHD